jgi:hypothetical protein
MKLLIQLCGLLASSSLALAGSITIASDSGTGNGQDILSNAAGETWTQTGTYTGVSISALLDGGVAGPGMVTAYLTDQIGAGTSATNDITLPSTVVAPTETRGYVTLFSNLTLGPGTYYLVLDGSAFAGPAGWSGTSDPTYTLDSGVGSVNELVISGTQAAFAPASTFTEPGTSAFFFDVTGTPGAPSAVPEPSTVCSLGTGLAGLVYLALRRSRARASR